MSDLHDLFTLGNENANGETETGNMFRGSEVKFKDKQDKKGTTKPSEDTTAPEDLAALQGIENVEAFQAPASESEDAAKEGTEGKSDDRLMSTIFSKSGVHSVLEHDAIVNSTASGRKRKVQADPAFIQREAKRTAAQAAAELKKAEEEARRTPIGVPTWTGLYGETGRPQGPAPRPAPSSSSRGGYGSTRGGRGGSARGGPSSSSILSNLAVRQGRTAPLPDSRSSTPGTSGTSTPTGFRGRQMLSMIRDFMQTHGGIVPTQMLVDHFNPYCRAAPGRNEEFKEMLKLIATLEHGSRGRGRWVLKEEWKATPAGAGAAAGRR